MSYSVDVNILLYASDTASPMHTSAREFLDARVADSDLFCLTWPTLMGYLRMATHPRIFEVPLTPDAAAANLAELLALPRVRVIAETDEFWNVYRVVTSGLVVRGNLVPDAHLVAILHLHGVERLYTCDRDFRKFDSIVAVDPLL